MHFGTIILKNLLRRPTRRLLSVAGIGVGIAAVVSLASLAWGLSERLHEIGILLAVGWKRRRVLRMQPSDALRYE
jgi:predicted lysophospholipase L1 biosynthesis ABC-type transport system permease subunit